MPAKFEKSKGDQTWFWVVVYSIESRRIAIELISQDTAFGTKHLLDANYETATHRKDRRDLKVFDDGGPASAIYLFRNFNEKTYPINTVIEYSTPAELHSLIAEMADAFGKVTEKEWQSSSKKQLQHATITFSSAGVSSVDLNGNVKRLAKKTVTLGAFRKAQTGDSLSIVIVHLGSAS